jgi:hypothetical protein
MPKKRALVALGLFAIVGCSFAGDFDSVALESANSRSATGHFTVRRVNDWTYAIKEGPKESFIRCYFAGSGTNKRCCYPVATEAEAAALLGNDVGAGDRTCQDF